MNRHLDAVGKGESDYDYDNDILLFKVKDRDYSMSIDFENFVLDVDTEGYVTGMQIFDASKVFRLDRLQLKNISGFEFHAQVEENVIHIQLRFGAVMRNKERIIQSQDFLREAMDSKLKDSEVMCTVA